MRGQDQRRAPGILGVLPLRLVIFGVAVALIAIVATVLTRLLVPPPPSPLHQLVMVKNVALPIIELLAYGLLVRQLEGRSAKEISFDRNGVRLLTFGLVTGTVLIAAVVAILWFPALATIRGGTGAQGLLAEILIPFTTAAIEELIFRAILFRLAEAMFGTTVAALLSSLLFALAHLGNPGATGVTTVILALDLGLLLALAFAVSRSLWLPIGLHMGWNLALGYVFGLANSGTFDPHSLYRMTLTGPAWLTGGTFGLESWLVTLVVSLLCSGALAAVALRRDRWQPLRVRWRAQQ